MKTLITVIILALPFVANAGQLKVYNYIDSENQYISFTGDIMVEDNKRMQVLLAQYPKITGVRIESDGGSTYGAKLLAQTIRTNDLMTLVPPGGRCASACINMFLGGKLRFAYRDSRFGIHPSHMKSIGAETTINDIFNDGQQHAMQYAYEWAKYVDTGKEFKAIQYLQSVYNQTDYKDMFWSKNIDLYKISVITNLLENE